VLAAEMACIFLLLPICLAYGVYLLFAALWSGVLVRDMFGLPVWFAAGIETIGQHWGRVQGCMLCMYCVCCFPSMSLWMKYFLLKNKFWLINQYIFCCFAFKTNMPCIRVTPFLTVRNILEGNPFPYSICSILEGNPFPYSTLYSGAV